MIVLSAKRQTRRRAPRNVNDPDVGARARVDAIGDAPSIGRQASRGPRAPHLAGHRLDSALAVDPRKHGTLPILDLRVHKESCLRDRIVAGALWTDRRDAFD